MIVIWPPQTKTKPEALFWLPEFVTGSQKRRTLLRLAEEKLNKLSAISDISTCFAHPHVDFASLQI